MTAAMPLAGSAQSTVFDNPDSRTRIAVKASYEYSIPVSQDIYGNTDALSGRSGFSFGPEVDIALWKNLTLDAGVDFFFNSFSIAPEILDGNTNVNKWEFERMSIFGSRINLFAGYRFDFSESFSVAVKTGPQLAIGFSTSAHSEMVDDPNTLYANVGDGYLTRADFLWGVGCDFLIKNHFLIGFTFSQGLTNMSDQKPNTFKQQIIQASAGYVF